MKITQQSRSMLSAVIQLCVIVPLLACTEGASAADPELETLRAKIEGVYALDEDVHVALAL